ncbi:MAG: hypothetical protein HDQ97_17965 [Lachnospiraceae bacterium]|nr:hypothetical protein [Lachnospiraceae bacterium]
MIKRRHILLSIVIGIGIIYLAGCKSGSEANPVENFTISDKDSAGSSMTEAEADTAVLAEESQGEAEEELEQKEPENEEDEPLKEVPQLSDTGRCQTAHCGRRKPHVDFGTSAFPTVQSRG